MSDTAVIYISTNSRNLTKNSQATFALAHDAASADGVNDGSFSRIHGQRKVGGLYHVYRQGLLFDCSSLSSVPGIVIESITLSIYFETWFYNDLANQSIVLVSGADLANPPVAADFGDLLDDTESWGSKATSLMTINAFNSIDMNAAGLAGVLAAIQGGGLAKIGLKTSGDNNNVACTTEDYCNVYIGSTNRAYLTITYHAALSGAAESGSGADASAIEAALAGAAESGSGVDSSSRSIQVPIEAALMTYLLAHADIAGLVQGRIYHVQAPQGVAKPYLVINKISGPRVKSHEANSHLAHPRFQFSAFAGTYGGAKAVILALQGALQGYRGTMGDAGGGGVAVGAVFYEDETDLDPGAGNELYGVAADYIIWHYE